MTNADCKTTEIIELSATKIAESIAIGALSATEIIEAFICRIEAVNKRINAIVVALFDSALNDASAVDKIRAHGGRTGPLAGVPFTVKESFDVKGTPTTMGLTHLAGHSAAADAVVVERLRNAGAILLGKTNASQLLMFNETDNPLYGRTSNPWNLSRAPGGSSGGEAAILAANGSALGIGSDIGGSVRLPAHACGIHSLRPTSRRLSLRGHATLYPGQETLIAQPGPMARYVEDLSLAMNVLAAPGQETLDPKTPPVQMRDPNLVSIAGLRIAYFDDNGVFRPSPSVRRAVAERPLRFAIEER